MAGMVRCFNICIGLVYLDFAINFLMDAIRFNPDGWVSIHREDSVEHFLTNFAWDPQIRAQLLFRLREFGCVQYNIISILYVFEFSRPISHQFEDIFYSIQARLVETAEPTHHAQRILGYHDWIIISIKLY